MITADFLKEMDVSRFRPTTINWQNLLREITDGYTEFRGISHGFQKDAVQNSWDARENKKGKGFSLTFELLEQDKEKFFIMTDKGTYGLTGRILKPEELDKDLPPQERWGRFENVAFTKDPAEGALGSRGRGKFIFVASSKPRILLYDTLRADGTYRFGLRLLKKTESPIDAYDGEEGKEKIKEFTKGIISPLSEVGTRVIIIDPTDELIKDIKSGFFLKGVNETWWEIIKKFDAKIILKYDEKEETATVPDEFALPEKDSKELKIWIKENLPIINGCRVHKLHLISKRKGEVPEELKGISIQRGGMKICCIEPEGLPPEIAGTIYGYVTVNKETELALKEAEGVEHYSTNFRKTIPQALKHLALNELYKFSQKKLGWNADPRAIQHQRQKNAERLALYAVNRLAKELGMLGMGGGGAGGAGGSSWKEIRINMPNPDFPRKNDLRINYKESLKNISMKVVNDSDSEINLKVKIFLRHQTSVLKSYAEKDLTLPAKSTSKDFGPFNEVFTSKKFPKKGKYMIVAKIISLRPEDKGEELDVKRKIFYLEETPEQKGLFEKCDAIKYPPNVVKFMGEAVPGEGKGFIFQYNIAHPAFKAVEEDEDELAGYLFRLMTHELCRIDLLQENPKLFKPTDKDSADTILGVTLRKLGEFSYKYYYKAE